MVPISLRYATADGELEHRQLLLSSRSTTVALKGEPAWLLVNEGAWGVYRVHYSDGLRRRLFGALGELDARERLGLVADVWAETVAGAVPLEGSLRLWSLLEDERDPDVWWAVAAGLGLLELVARDDDLQALQRLVRRLAGMAFAEIGWGPGSSGTAGAATGGGERTDGAPGAGEEPRLARLRARLVTLLGTVGSDREVRAQARQRLADADAGRSPLPPDLATAVAQVVAAGGADDEWELLYSHYRKAATPQDEVRYLQALGGFSQPHLVRRSLELALSGEVRTQDAPYLVASILGRRDGCALAWECIEEHWDEMQSRWPPNSFHRVLESLPALVAAHAPARAGGARAPADGTVPPGGAAVSSVPGGGVAGGGVADQALAWLDTHPLARGGRKVAQARERLEINIAFRRRVAGQLAAALSRSA